VTVEHEGGVVVSGALEAVGGISHGFATRAVPPEPDALARSAGLRCIRTLRQVHGTRCLVVEGCSRREDEPREGDALVASSPGVGVGVRTADCVPVLVAWDGGRAVAAVHAGWRGTLGGVVREAVALMRERFGGDAGGAVAAVGPAIGPCCYEVGWDVAGRFIDSYPWSRRFIEPCGGGKYLLDLKGVNAHVLKMYGVGEVDVSPICTRCDGRFHSLRRDGARASGQISFIGVL